MLSVKNIRGRKKRHPKAMTTEYLGMLVTKARINTQGIEALAHFKVSKISCQTTLLKVKF